MVISVTSPELPPLSEALASPVLSATCDMAADAIPSSLPTTTSTGSSTGLRLHYTASTSTTSAHREEEEEEEGDKRGVSVHWKAQSRPGNWLSALLEDEQEPTIMFEAEEFSLFEPSHLMTMLERDSLKIPRQGENQGRLSDISSSAPPGQEPSNETDAHTHIVR